MATFFFFRLILVVVLILLLTGSIIIIMNYYFKLQKPVISPQDKNENRKIFLPLRLQAYERIILFLERISPQNLIQRVSRPEMNSVQLQSSLTRTIRDEFEYNLSQQLYISARSWELVKNAKEETIMLIHTAAGKTTDGTSPQELIKLIFDQMVENEKQPVDFAIEEIKKEVNQFMNS